MSPPVFVFDGKNAAQYLRNFKAIKKFVHCHDFHFPSPPHLVVSPKVRKELSRQQLLAKKTATLGHTHTPSRNIIMINIICR